MIGAGEHVLAPVGSVFDCAAFDVTVGPWRDDVLPLLPVQIVKKVARLVVLADALHQVPLINGAQRASLVLEQTDFMHRFVSQVLFCDGDTPEDHRSEAWVDGLVSLQNHGQVYVDVLLISGAMRMPTELASCLQSRSVQEASCCPHFDTSAPHSHVFRKNVAREPAQRRGTQHSKFFHLYNFEL